MRGKWAEAKEYLQNYDIVTITETKLDEKATLGSITVKNYTSNRLDRNSNGGGNITFINESLKPTPLEEIQSKFNLALLEVTVTKIELNSRTKAIIVGAYRPPNSRKAWFEVFNELILTLTMMEPLIIMGDLNSNLLKPNAQPGKSLLLSLSLASTIVKNPAPTRIGSSSESCFAWIRINSTAIFPIRSTVIPVVRY